MSRTSTEDEWDAFVDQNSPWMYTLAYYRLRDVTDAEQAVNGAFRRLARVLVEGKSVAKPRQWLSRTLRNLCVDMLRKRTRDRARFVPIDPVPDFDRRDEERDFPDPHGDALTQIIEKEEARAALQRNVAGWRSVEICLSVIPKDQCDVLALRFRVAACEFREETAKLMLHEEIAYILGIPVETVRTRLHRGLTRVRALTSYIDLLLIGLPKTQRSVLAKYLDGLSILEIGNALGIGGDRVNSLLHDGLKRLRDMLTSVPRSKGQAGVKPRKRAEAGRMEA